MSKVSDRKPLFVDTSKSKILGVIFSLWKNNIVEVSVTKLQISLYFNSDKKQTDSNGVVLTTPLEYRAVIDPNVFNEFKIISSDIIKNYNPDVTSKTKINGRQKKKLLTIPKTLSKQEQRREKSAEQTLKNEKALEKRKAKNKQRN